MKFAVTYFQPDDPYGSGFIVFAGEVKRASSRLDRLGAVATAGSYRIPGPDGSEWDVVVRCVRESEQSVEFRITCIDENGRVIGKTTITEAIDFTA